MKPYYVYIYRDDSRQDRHGQYRPWYVGKGSGGRAYDVESRSPFFKNRFNALRARGARSIVQRIPCDSEADAFDLERLLILEIGRLDIETGPLCNQSEGGEGTSKRGRRPVVYTPPVAPPMQVNQAPPRRIEYVEPVDFNRRMQELDAELHRQAQRRNSSRDAEAMALIEGQGRASLLEKLTRMAGTRVLPAALSGIRTWRNDWDAWVKSGETAGAIAAWISPRVPKLVDEAMADMRATCVHPPTPTDFVDRYAKWALDRIAEQAVNELAPLFKRAWERHCDEHPIGALAYVKLAAEGVFGLKKST